MGESFHKKYNAWLKCSGALRQGDQREYMEDRLTTFSVKQKNIGRNIYVFLVLDGHGGSEVADYVKDTFPKLFKEGIYKGKKIRKLVPNICETLDDMTKARQLESGTTFSVLIVDDKKGKPLETWVANCGDSSIYGICRNELKNRVDKLSEDHGVNRKHEKNRVSSSKCFSKIKRGYLYNLDGSRIAMTRAIGDHEFGDMVLATPKIKKVKIPYNIFFLASDGIWDVMKGKQLLNLCTNKEFNHWKESAKRLNDQRNELYEQHDNTSLLIVFLDRSKRELHL